MLRVLYIFLAVLAVVLTYLVAPDFLFPLLGVMLVAMVGMAFGWFFGRKKDDDVKAAGDSRDEELSSLGIVSIRPKGTGPSPVDEDIDSDGIGAVRPAQARTSAPSDRGSTGSTFGVSAATVRRKTIAEAHETDERLKKEMLVPFLHAVQAAVGATTVCLLKQDETGLRYHLEAVVSKNGYARSYGDFTTKTPLLPGRKARKPVTLLRVGGKGISPKSLGYYAEPIIAVRQIALAVIPQPDNDAPYILLADTMEEGGLGTRRQRTLLEQFAGVLGTILDAHETLEEAVEEAEPEIEEAEPRPRRDIIAEEMRNARVLELPLSLALVYLNRAEEVAEQGQEAVLDAEATLEAHLRTHAEGTDAFRIERFGELTFGVFYRGGLEEVESWAVDLQNELAGPLEGGVSIGIAVMQDHHESPDTFRADATEALREAFESGTCTIIG